MKPYLKPTRYLLVVIITLLSLAIPGVDLHVPTAYAAAPNQANLVFTNAGWQPTNSARIPYVTRYADRVVLNCSAGVDVVLEYNLPAPYDGSVSFDVSASSSQVAFLLTTRNASTNPQKGVNIGRRGDAGWLDYAGKQIGWSKFFYGTLISQAVRANSAVTVKQPNIRNTVEFRVTPKGGYARINGINLAYLATNRGRPGVVDSSAFYPVSYDFTSYNQFQVGCPWAGLNTMSAGTLTVYNPVVQNNAPLPALTTIVDKREFLKRLATDLLNSFPRGAYRPNPLPSVGGGDVSARIAAILALADAYLFTANSTVQARIEDNLRYAATYVTYQPSISPPGCDKGETFTTIAMAYWIATTKYPSIEGLLVGSETIDAKIKRWATTCFLVEEHSPFPWYVGRAGPNSGVGAFLEVAGSMYPTSLPLAQARGKCYVFHSATKSFSDATPSCETAGVTMRTKTIYNGLESCTNTSADSKDWREACTRLEPSSMGMVTAGRRDNHNYGPHPHYTYSVMGTGLYGTIALGSWQDQNFGGAFSYVIDNLWDENLRFIDFNRNLWNSTSEITLLKPNAANGGGDLADTVPCLGTSLSEPHYDWRGYDAQCENIDSQHKRFANMFREYGKTDRFLDPANVMNGLIAGAVKNNRYTEANALLTHIWYISRDYGAIPYDTIGRGDNLTSDRWKEIVAGNRVWMKDLIYPATSIERYVVAAMLLDTGLNITSLE